ncbi:MAG TPA: efflux RND transporter periplasmic adaptor subunit [Steroidobacteraceae bacterium]|jgi:multidrug efflux system membrane fusion protein|nr:efflux RND transporter periplasmic adaptor subunit [Steroidobacteraceae bacterium]
MKHRLVWVFALALLAVLIAWAWRTHRSEPTAAGAHKDHAAVAVETAVAARQDVPVYLEGLGNVQAFYTAKINSRVDGQLERVGFTEGQLVRKGDLLAQIDPRPLQAALEQARAMQAKDNAQLDSAKRDLDRYMVLAPRNLISQQVLDSQRAQVAQLQAQVQVDAAAIDSARTQLDYATITAPFAGRTGIRLVDPGNIVHASDTAGIVVLTQIQPISVVFTLPEDSISQVTTAMTSGTLTVSALSRDDRTQLDEGKLALVDNQIDTTTGTVRLKATFENRTNALWPGQFVNCRILLQQRHDAITVPSIAVQRGPDGMFAYVVKADSTVDVRPIETAQEVDGFTVISGGLAAGERVVTSNQYRLQPGSTVRLIAPKPNDMPARAPAVHPSTPSS